MLLQDENDTVWSVTPMDIEENTDQPSTASIANDLRDERVALALRSALEVGSFVAVLPRGILATSKDDIVIGQIVEWNESTGKYKICKHIRDFNDRYQPKNQFLSCDRNEIQIQNIRLQRNGSLYATSVQKLDKLWH